MTLPLIITLQDGVQVANTPVVGINAFGTELRDTLYRLRVRNLQIMASIRQDVGASLSIMDEAEVSGSGTAGLFFAAFCAYGMTTTAATAGARVRQTRIKIPHQHGNTLMVLLEVRWGVADAGTTARIGMHDEVDGLFFQLDSDFSVGWNNNSISNVIPRASWSGDPLDGTGSSGFILDPNQQQLAFIEFDPNNVVRWGFYIEGIPIIVHETFVANNNAVPLFCDTMLPLRYEIENDGTGIANFIACSALVVLGERTVQASITRSINRGITTPFSTAAINTLYPILVMRVKSTIRASVIIPIQINMLSLDTSNYFVGLFVNPTFTGAEAPVYTGITGSGLEYTTGYTSATTIINDPSDAIISGYGADVIDVTNIDLETNWSIGRDILGVSDLFVLAVATVQGGAVENYYGAVTFREII